MGRWKGPNPMTSHRPALTAHQARLALLCYAREHRITIKRTTLGRASDKTFSAVGALCAGPGVLRLACRDEMPAGRRVDPETLMHELAHALTDGGVDSWEGADASFCRVERHLARMVGGLAELARTVARHAEDAAGNYDPHSQRSYDRGQRWSRRHAARLARVRAALAAEGSR